MAVNFSEECQNVHSVVVVLPDGGATNPQYEPEPTVCHVEVPDLMENELCLNSETNLLNQTNLMTDKVDNYALCNLNVAIEKGRAEIPICSEESIGYLKSDDSLAKALQKEIWLQLTGKFMQLFMNQSPDLPKVASKDRFVADRVYDTTTNRLRKYKRSPSFNSRRVVLLFSIMSSIGTIILIYLTLRVRQISDGSGIGFSSMYVDWKSGMAFWTFQLMLICIQLFSFILIYTVVGLFGKNMNRACSIISHILGS